ncbi:MAG: peptidoglycan-binding protein [Winogradskyella sp.]|uniref:peptidoglycan-binding domain-containing protein n=1 Tax=Winogradskyella sp. TaxID=1883156 RepID=UPI000F3F2289|nr:peptidoglycan-binding domain-containing protein [Winogradskyella sp.]RNC88080.1 MAG: peptidoglycan-binding protein [Winogradskyella sp.]
MKKLLIFILVVILLLFAYNKYDDYKRYHPESTNYNISEAIDINYHNQELLFKYYEAVESLNSYRTMQWSANSIDAVHPEDEDEQTKVVVNEYAKKLAKVKFYEAKLKASKDFKDKGLNNEDIKHLEHTNTTIEAYKKEKQHNTFKTKMLDNFPSLTIRIGQKSAYIYEVQKLLKAQGYEMPIDGVFRNITSDALKDFEAKNNLFPDGLLDRMDLEALLDK